MKVPSLAEWLHEATEMLELKPSTRKSYEGLVELLVSSMGDPAIDRVSPLDVQRFVSSTGLSASRTRQAHSVLRGAYRMAVQYGLVDSNPCLTTRLPRLPRTTRRALTREEVGRLADAAGNYSSLVWFLATTGLRWSEVAELKGGDVDGRRVSVSRARVRGVVGTPKSHCQRVVFAPDWVELPEVGADEYVWRSARGNPLRHSNFIGTVWKRAVEGSGVRATPHELRHTACSWMLEAGVPVHVVQKVMGHSTPVITLAVYAHALEGELEAAARSLSA